MATTRAPKQNGKLLNRELSTVEYNARLLELAADDALPLLERVRMCKFFSSNLDEFFMVRVAGLMDQAASGLAVRSVDGLTPRETLAAIRVRVSELVDAQSQLWRKKLRVGDRADKPGTLFEDVTQRVGGIQLVDRGASS